ncbi:MAG TPA: DUF3127 domain-containing protein [Cyclobacteriaceae bacterium]|nr:DUF3127 domain-containing protein [Cyclobacteriaceae bacterium]
MSMDIKGKVIQLLSPQTGQGKKGVWKKQEFVIETQSQYPKKVCLSMWGDKIDQFRLSVGETVTVSFELESREYNSRWYTEARAWKVSKDGSSGGGQNQYSEDMGDEPMNSSASSASDDLPF